METYKLTIKQIEETKNGLIELGAQAVKDFKVAINIAKNVRLLENQVKDFQESMKALSKKYYKTDKSGELEYKVDEDKQIKSLIPISKEAEAKFDIENKKCVETVFPVEIEKISREVIEKAYAEEDSTLTPNNLYLLDIYLK